MARLDLTHLLAARGRVVFDLEAQTLDRDPALGGDSLQQGLVGEKGPRTSSSIRLRKQRIPQSRRAPSWRSAIRGSPCPG